jgi:hypothetical protein
MSVHNARVRQHEVLRFDFSSWLWSCDVSWTRLIRQTHRWLGVIFTLAVGANIVVMSAGKAPPEWITYSPLIPLVLMWLSGMYLFVLPYTAKRQSRPGHE